MARATKKNSPEPDELGDLDDVQGALKEAAQIFAFIHASLDWEWPSASEPSRSNIRFRV